MIYTDLCSRKERDTNALLFTSVVSDSDCYGRPLDLYCYDIVTLESAPRLRCFTEIYLHSKINSHRPQGYRDCKAYDFAQKLVLVSFET